MTRKPVEYELVESSGLIQQSAMQAIVSAHKQGHTFEGAARRDTISDTQDTERHNLLGKGIQEEGIASLNSSTRRVTWADSDLSLPLEEEFLIPGRTLFGRVTSASNLPRLLVIFVTVIIIMWLLMPKTLPPP